MFAYLFRWYGVFQCFNVHSQNSILDNTEAIELLAKAGANVNLPTYDGFLPLGATALGGNKFVFKCCRSNLSQFVTKQV